MAGQLTIDTLKGTTGALAVQNGMTGIVKAWATFAGSTAAIYGGAGTGSFNISSITRNTTGDYTINFTTAMPSASYAVIGSSSTIAGVNNSWLEINSYFGPSTQAPTASAFRVFTQNSGSALDATYISVAVLSN